MSFARRAKEAAKAARSKAGEAASAASQTASDPATQERIDETLAGTSKRAREAVGMARRGLTTAVESIDPRMLADLIVKATWLQETTNASLREKGSPYRIAELHITASIPPGVSFVIGRVDEPAEALQGEVRLSQDLIGQDTLSGDVVLALDGATLDEATLDELIETAAVPGETTELGP